MKMIAQLLKVMGVRTRVPKEEPPQKHITPESHFLIEGWGNYGRNKMFFPRYALTDDQLKLLSHIIKMVLRASLSDRDRIEQNLFSKEQDYLFPVTAYLQRHPAATGALESISVSAVVEGDRLVVVLDGEIKLSARETRDELSPSFLLLKLVSDIARSGDIAYLEPLAHGKGGDTLGAPWKPLTLQVSTGNSWRDFGMSGHGATTLSRLGFDIGDQKRDVLVIPVYYHQKVNIPYKPEGGAYGYGEKAAQIYIDRWLNRRGLDSGFFDEPHTRCVFYDHAQVFFPPPERCLFVTKDGRIGVGAATPEACAKSLEVDGYAIRLADAWATSRDLYGTPSSQKCSDPRVFHPLAVKRFFYETLGWCIPRPKAIQRALYTPAGGVKLLGKEEKFYPALCRLFPCHCGRKRSKAKKCHECSGHFCEHCGVDGKFCSTSCARVVSSRTAQQEETSGFAKFD